MSSKFYTISYFTSFGLRMYLSNVGYTVKDMKSLVFEPGYLNAHKFDTEGEARIQVEVAMPVHGTQLMIQKHSIKKDGTAEISIVN